MHATIYKTKSLRPASSKYKWESEYFRTSRRGGVPPAVPTKNFGFAQNPWVALAEAGGSGPPDPPPPASYAPALDSMWFVVGLLNCIASSIE